MKIKHYDLFAGIGGFSYALDTIFNEQKNEHIFCEWETFPTAVLKKHWPDATYYGDIADLVTDTNSQRNSNGLGKVQEANGEVPKRNDNAKFSNSNRSNDITIVTGGFPCQPFSHAGRRKGTADDRYKWPEMFAVIRNVRPDWVIAENVRGLASWNDGMVLETVCADLEAEGYEVRPYIIPACSKGAPHRRERVWIVAHTKNINDRGNTGELSSEDEQQTSERQEERTAKLSGTSEQYESATVATNAVNSRQGRTKRESNGTSDSVSQEYRAQDSTSREPERAISDGDDHRPWNADWREVALATCHDGVDDGLPRRLDGATYRGKPTDCISAAQHRKDRLKACGNAIVPQVAMEIFRAIKSVDNQ